MLPPAVNAAFCPIDGFIAPGELPTAGLDTSAHIAPAFRFDFGFIDWARGRVPFTARAEKGKNGSGQRPQRGQDRQEQIRALNHFALRAEQVHQWTPCQPDDKG
ncbi:MAG: hypothetical protein RBS68_16350 [Anaerolineales bacterium]|nr:hypothetical protein [Anaerolineales bacterium]